MVPCRGLSVRARAGGQGGPSADRPTAMSSGDGAGRWCLWGGVGTNSDLARQDGRLRLAWWWQGFDDAGGGRAGEGALIGAAAGPRGDVDGGQGSREGWPRGGQPPPRGSAVMRGMGRPCWTGERGQRQSSDASHAAALGMLGLTRPTDGCQLWIHSGRLEFGRRGVVFGRARAPILSRAPPWGPCSGERARARVMVL